MHPGGDWDDQGDSGFGARRGPHRRATALEISGLTIESLKDHTMNKLTATLLACCATFLTAGAFAADSTSNDPASKDAVSQESTANDGTEHDAMSADSTAKEGMKEDAMKEDTMSHDSMAKDGTNNNEVKQ
jgi:pentapeptide MXKDX repeat protein